MTLHTSRLITKFYSCCLECQMFQMFPHFFAVLDRDVVELHHHLIVERFSGADVLELQQRVEGDRRRAQGREGLVDEVNGFSFDSLEQQRGNRVTTRAETKTNDEPFHTETRSRPHLNLALEVLDDFFPIFHLANVEEVKVQLLDGQDQAVHRPQHVVDTPVLACYVLHLRPKDFIKILQGLSVQKVNTQRAKNEIN